MGSETFIKPSTGNVVCGFFSLVIIFILIISPSIRIHEEIDPVFKSQRPYKSDISIEKSIDNYSLMRIAKKDKYYHAIIIKASNKYKVDPALVKAIIMAESSYNPRAVSKKGAIGLMQLMPATAGDLGVIDLYNPSSNIDAGVRYLKMLLMQFDGDLSLALAAYNAGSRKVKKYQGIPPYKATQYYIKKVIEYYEFYQSRTV